MCIKNLKIVKPPIYCYLHHAYSLTASIDHKDFQKWFLSNYIQLEYVLEDNTLNFFKFVIAGICIYNPLLDYRILDLDFIHRSNTNIIDFIVSSIDMGYYVTTYLDEFYIPDREAYQKRHFRYDNMIFGYDLSRKILKIIGYTDKYAYNESCISFSEFESSYNHSVERRNDVILLRPKDENSYLPSFDFDIVNVKNLLEDFLLSRNTSERLRIINNPTKNVIFGMSVYREIINNFKSVLEEDKKECNMIALHVLWEHKKTMVSRIEYLIDNNYINRDSNLLESYSQLRNKALSFRNMIIKFNINKNRRLVEMVIAGLEKMVETEKKLVTDLLDKLAHF
ncbi:hypothetical protein [Ruminiclostridium josui]|uniref:hypothetical protein n=1 Tax=Ruminiclostridium josui TaxID=1499 RepID=UPI0006D2339D|nr:hypothetical protein [Ruminiclostridium josui]